MLIISRLTSILILGFCLRFAAVYFGLPHLYHADEPIVVNHALAYGGGDLNPHFFKIPPLLSYFLFFVYGLFYLAGKILGVFSSPADFEQLFYSDPSFFYLLGRIFAGGIPGTLSIYALYKMADRYFSKETALTAALFLAVSFLHVRDSHYIYPDILLSLMMILSFYVFFQQDSRFKASDALYAGMLIGLCSAFKYNGAVMALIYAIYHAAVSRDSYFRNMTLAAASSIFIFILLNPFALLDYSTFFSEVVLQSKAQGGTPWQHHFLYSLSGNFGWPLLSAVLAGGFLSFFSKNKKLITLTLFCLIYYGVLVKAGQPYDRYVLPIIPAACILAAEFFRKLQLRGIIKGIALIILIMIPLSKAIVWDFVMTRQDVRTLAKVWIESNLKPGSVIALDWEFYMPPLNFSRQQLLDKKSEILNASTGHSSYQLRKLEFLIKRTEANSSFDLHFLTSEPDRHRFLFAKPVIPYDYKILEKQGVEYVLIAEYPGLPAHSGFLKDLKINAEKIKSWSPFKSSGQISPLDTRPLTAGPFTLSDIFSRERNGYHLTLYRVRQSFD